jgi:large subunit ribosomal protein L9
MKVILLKGVPKLGKPDDVVEVNDGYAQNALFPRKLAIPATASALANLKTKQDGRAAQKAEQRSLLDAAIKSINDQTIAYTAPANEKGSLFSKIDAADIAKFLKDEHRISIDPKCITIPEGHIKTVGTHTIAIQDGGYAATVTIEIAKK